MCSNKGSHVLLMEMQIKTATLEKNLAVNHEVKHTLRA